MNEPVKCVCGCEAQVNPVGGCWCVECHECGRRTPGHFAAGMAVEHWAKDQLALKSHKPLVKACRLAKEVVCHGSGWKDRDSPAHSAGHALKDVLALVDAAAASREVIEQDVQTDKVIEVDLDDPGECHFCDYEQGMCHADAETRSCVQGSASDPKNAHAPPWCPARGRVIVRANRAYDTDQGGPG